MQFFRFVDDLGNVAFVNPMSVILVADVSAYMSRADLKIKSTIALTNGEILHSQTTADEIVNQHSKDDAVS